MTTEKILSAITKAIDQSPVPVGGVLMSAKIWAKIPSGTIQGLPMHVSAKLKDWDFALCQLPITITE